MNKKLISILALSSALTIIITYLIDKLYRPELMGSLGTEIKLGFPFIYYTYWPTGNGTGNFSLSHVAPESSPISLVLNMLVYFVFIAAVIYIIYLLITRGRKNEK